MLDGDVPLLAVGCPEIRNDTECILSRGAAGRKKWVREAEQGHTVGDGIVVSGTSGERTSAQGTAERAVDQVAVNSVARTDDSSIVMERFPCRTDAGIEIIFGEPHERAIGIVRLLRGN